MRRWKPALVVACGPPASLCGVDFSLFSGLSPQEEAAGPSNTLFPGWWLNINPPPCLDVGVTDGSCLRESRASGQPGFQEGAVDLWGLAAAAFIGICRRR